MGGKPLTVFLTKEVKSNYHSKKGGVGRGAQWVGFLRYLHLFHDLVWRDMYRHFDLLFCFFCFLFCFFFETGSHYVDMPGWNSLCIPGWLHNQRATCLCLKGAIIKGVCHHAWLHFFFKFQNKDERT